MLKSTAYAKVNEIITDAYARLYRTSARQTAKRIIKLLSPGAIGNGRLVDEIAYDTQEALSVLCAFRYMKCEDIERHVYLTKTIESHVNNILDFFDFDKL